MTIKPRGKKFRVRGQNGATSEGEPFEIPVAGDEGDSPVIDRSKVGNSESSNPNSLEAIRKEGLTGRQLRMARRTAQKYNLPVTSDFDAVRVLRENSIDPFQRTSMLDMVQPAKSALAKIDPVRLPQTVGNREVVSSPEVEGEDPAASRAREIQAMQRDIMRRRRQRMTLLALRLSFFVFLPTLISGYYFYNIATPMYSTTSSFLIQQNDASPAAAGGGGLGALMGAGSPLATVQDSIAVQGYLLSEAAMIRLDKDHNFKEHFATEQIDPLSRLGQDATNAEAYKVYLRNVKIGYDPTEGIINMEVIAATPEVSVEFSEALIGYAEGRISNLTQRLREDQMKGARQSSEEAALARREALERLVSLQAEFQIADPTGLIASLQGQISTLEQELTSLQIQLAEQLENRRPNQARVTSLNGQIDRREDRIVELEAQLTSTTGGNLSAAEKQARLRVAEEDYLTANMNLQTASQGLVAAREAADRQVRYLAPSVSPVAPDEPKYPRSFENTLLAFLIFSGIYLMMSLTASILSEQI